MPTPRLLIAAITALIFAFTSLTAMLATGTTAACTTPATLPPTSGASSTGVGGRPSTGTTTIPHASPTTSPDSSPTPGTPASPASTLTPAAVPVPVSVPESIGRFTPEQISNATAITTTGSQLGIPVRGWIIAVATAIQESDLRTLNHGDTAGPDSRGLFQQRAPWGPTTERMDPAGSARLFYTGGHTGQPGLLDIPNWQTMPLTQAAQAVQRSAYPNAYAAHETEATHLVATITRLGLTPGSANPATACQTPSGPVAAQVIAFARSQIGQPYLWGGDGASEGGWDCSGLTTAAYASAGITLPRTAQTQYNTGPHLPPGAPLMPGDLLFFGSSPSDVTHVGIYLSTDRMIDAPHAGAVVRIENRHRSNYLGATRPGMPQV